MSVSDEAKPSRTAPARKIARRTGLSLQRVVSSLSSLRIGRANRAGDDGRSRLLALPAEVRNLVFEFLVESESINDSVPHCLRLRFLLTCRQIHQETCLLAFEKMQWRVRNMSRLCPGLALLRPQKRRAIQSVTLLAQALSRHGRVYLRSRIEAPVMQAPRPSVFWGPPPLTLVSVTLAVRRLPVVRLVMLPSPIYILESAFLVELPRHIKTLKRIHVLMAKYSIGCSMVQPCHLVRDLVELVAQQRLKPFEVPPRRSWNVASPVPLSWLAPDRLPFSLSSPLTPMTLMYEVTCERAEEQPRVVDLFVTDNVPDPLYYRHVTLTHR
ncbi:MAG: hypothetical protein M1815_001744 [Lichina confinis]|nr:MAG: hypothetical protein M1815_001744 [Lichina confinis]